MIKLNLLIGWSKNEIWLYHYFHSVCDLPLSCDSPLLHAFGFPVNLWRHFWCYTIISRFSTKRLLLAISSLLFAKDLDVEYVCIQIHYCQHDNNMLLTPGFYCSTRVNVWTSFAQNAVSFSASSVALLAHAIVSVVAEPEVYKGSWFHFTQRKINDRVMWSAT